MGFFHFMDTQFRRLFLSKSERIVMDKVMSAESIGFLYGDYYFNLTDGITLRVGRIQDSIAICKNGSESISDISDRLGEAIRAEFLYRLYRLRLNANMKICCMKPKKMLNLIPSFPTHSRIN